jgi:hypothetical protein
MVILDKVKEQIKKCEEKLVKLSIASENYIEAHNKYVEEKGEVVDAFFIKEKMKEKVVRVIDK